MAKRRSSEMVKVDKLVDKWAKRFGLFGVTGWQLTVEVKNAGEGGLTPDIGSAINSGGLVAGSCDASPAYKTAKLEFSRDEIRESGVEELDDLVKHEMLHVVLSPIYQFVCDMFDTFPQANKRRLMKSWSQVNEGVTTDLERIIK